MGPRTNHSSGNSCASLSGTAQAGGDRTSLEFAVQHPDDPRVPEALSRAVKNTRMNCNNARTGALSKKAFDLLHSRYSDTAWAKNTKYWYGSDQ